MSPETFKALEAAAKQLALSDGRCECDGNDWGDSFATLRQTQDQRLSLEDLDALETVIKHLPELLAYAKSLASYYESK